MDVQIKVIYSDLEPDIISVNASDTIINIKQLISERNSFQTSKHTKNLSNGEFDISTTGRMEDIIKTEASSLTMASEKCLDCIMNGEAIPIYIHPTTELKFQAVRPQGLLNPEAKRSFTYVPHKLRTQPPLAPSSSFSQSEEEKSKTTNWKDNFSAWQRSFPKPLNSNSRTSVMSPLSTRSTADPYYWIALVSQNGSVAKLKCEVSATKEQFIKDAIKQLQKIIESLQRGTVSIVDSLDGSSMYGKRTEVNENEPLLHDKYINQCLVLQELPKLCIFPNTPRVTTPTKASSESNIISEAVIHKFQATEKQDLKSSAPQLESLSSGFSQSESVLEPPRGIMMVEKPSDQQQTNNSLISNFAKSKIMHVFGLIVPSKLFDNLVIARKFDKEIDHFKNEVIPVVSKFFPKKKLDIPFTRITQRNWAITSLPNSFPITFNFSNNTQKVLTCNESTLISDILAMITFNPASKQQQQDLISNSFLLKFSSRNEYLHPSMTFGMITRIRDNLKRNVQIELTVVDINEVIEKYGDIPDYLAEYQPRTEGDLFGHLIKRNDSAEQSSIIDITELAYNFQVRLINITVNTELFSYGNSDSYQIEVNLYHGDSMLCSPIWSKVNSNFEFNQWVGTSEIKMSQIPRATKVCFTVYMKRFKELTPIGSVNFQYFNYLGYLRFGNFTLPLWPNAKANPLGNCTLNVDMLTTLNIMIEFPSYCDKLVKFPSYRQLIYGQHPAKHQELSTLNPKIHSLVTADPLYKMSSSEKGYVWTNRQILVGFPKALPKLLQCVNWKESKMALEALRLLPIWATLSPTEALQLLDYHFVVPEVREFAVNCLHKISDASLEDYLLQLVQVLKYEAYHNSPLARFLLQRSLQNRQKIGQSFFWLLKSELNTPESSERYLLLLEAYFQASGEHALELIRQNELCSQLAFIADTIKQSKKKLRSSLLSQQMASLHLPEPVQLPISSAFTVSSVVVEKCKFMDSFTLPLWVVFNNPHSNDQIQVIFKCGDDLRADILTLQMFRIMNRLWLSNGLDLQLSPYLCTATAEGAGMIEVVPNAKTAASIQKDNAGLAGALLKTPLAKWLKEQNQTESEYDKAVDNFTRSLAGYCVATYVLGIGDRHNDNIMITKSGHLFHIDFAHFLGNVQMWSGIKRERAPFVLTSEFAYVMGVTTKKDRKSNLQFQKFVSWCCEGFNILRRNAHLFITLFSMMLSTGIPELRCDDDIAYLRNAFALDRTEEEAWKLFEELIEESLNTKATTVNFVIHNFAHANS